MGGRGRERRGGREEWEMGREERGRGGILPDQSKYGCYGPVGEGDTPMVTYSLLRNDLKI